MDTNLMVWISDPKNWIATAISAPIAISALYLALKNYKRKSGILIHGTFRLSSSINCNDSYVSGITLENVKDRATTIYNIYLKVGHNYYIELENHEDKPLILKPYETYGSTSGEILFHSVNCRKIKMEALLNNKKVKKKLVLSTSEGKYTIPKPTRRWSPISDFFKNHSTGLIQPIIATHKGKNIGENIRFIVDITYKNGEHSTFLLRDDDYQYKRFNNFHLTKPSLHSKDSLRTFFESELAENFLPAGSNLEIYDFNDHKEKINTQYHGPIQEAPFYSFFRYHILGRLNTRLARRKTKTKTRTENI